MAKKKGVARNFVHLECVSCRKGIDPFVSRYISSKNKKNTTALLDLKKYCRYEKKHTSHKEVR